MAILMSCRDGHFRCPDIGKPYAKDSGPSLRPEQTTALRTLLPFAHAAFAGAENTRIRSGGVSAVQRIFRFRTFERVGTGKIQTTLSLQHASPIKMRDRAAVRDHRLNCFVFGPSGAIEEMIPKSTLSWEDDELARRKRNRQRSAFGNLVSGLALMPQLDLKGLGDKGAAHQKLVKITAKRHGFDPCF